MYDSLLGTAVIGAMPKNKVIKDMLNKYNFMNVKQEANNMYMEYFLNKFPDFKLNNNIVIYPKEYFERSTYNKKIHFSEHHYTATWKSNNTSVVKKILRMIIPNVIYRNITHKRALKYTPFYKVYLKHKELNK